MADARDYRKFLNSDGTLHPRYLPRRLYTKLVNLYREDEAIIDEVFEELYLAWDLEQKLDVMKSAGRNPDKQQAAQEVLDELEDRDWWLATAAFERAFTRDFAATAGRWSEFLDPVYDDQEANGWRDLS